jgi:hypothetical protein
MTARTFATAVSLVMAGAWFAPLGAAAAPATSTATSQALSLTLRDVQHVYGSTFRPFIANTYKASHYSTCGADYTGGYLATFGNFQKSNTVGGVISVENTVFTYANSRSTACASKSHGASFTRALHRPGTTIHTSPLGGVGDSAYLFTVSSSVNSSAGAAKKHAYSVMIWLARGTHIAMVTVSALGSPPAQSGAIALAKIIDGRIAVAG